MLQLHDLAQVLSKEKRLHDVHEYEYQESFQSRGSMASNPRTSMASSGGACWDDIFVGKRMACMLF